MPLDISVMMDTKLRIAPETMPLVICGTVTLMKVLIFDAPRLMAASSVLIGICIIVAVADRLVYGIRRIASAMTMMAMVPVSEKYFVLKAMISAMPMTAPGMM